MQYANHRTWEHQSGTPVQWHTSRLRIYFFICQQLFKLVEFFFIGMGLLVCENSVVNSAKDEDVVLMNENFSTHESGDLIEGGFPESELSTSLKRLHLKI